MTRCLKVLLIVGAVLILSATLARTYMMKNGYRVVWGRSMYGTMPYLTLIHITTTDKVAEYDLGYFLSPMGELCVKRITSISKGGRWFWMTADNRGWNGQDSAEYGWVGRSNLLGIVDRRWPNRSQKQWLRQVLDKAVFYPELSLINYDGAFLAWTASGSNPINGGDIFKVVDRCLTYVGSDGNVWSFDGNAEYVLGAGMSFAISPNGEHAAFVRSSGLVVIDLKTGLTRTIPQGGHPSWVGNTELDYAVETGEPGNWIKHNLRVR